MRSLKKSEIRRVRGGVECGPSNALSRILKRKRASTQAVQKVRAVAEKVCPA